VVSCLRCAYYGWHVIVLICFKGEQKIKIKGRRNERWKKGKIYRLCGGGGRGGGWVEEGVEKGGWVSG